MANSPLRAPSPQLPSLIPGARAWVNAVGLILLLLAWQYVLTQLYEHVILLINWRHISPKVWYVLLLLAFLSPIAVVAFAHHWMHRLLDNFFPESKLPETETVPGTFPGIMSWWQGLFGWVAKLISSAIAYTTLALFLSDNALSYYFLKFFTDGWNVWRVVPIIIQIIIAAFLYQFEYSVNQRLIAAARR
ncbi:hypothetical protein NIES4071_23410 [Calothrix sp. NIES-4071]|nr:hypothetical protein NIES4071_23410 [Calothrix sp. NIES-4071]BAZ56666.1 hypothetical protein NIES4105_23360 [Calothrix sp. NIES-4105]